MPPNISVVDAEFDFENYAYRTPLKFGGIVTDKVTVLNVRVRVKDRSGKEIEGFGSMPLGNVWSFPSRVHTYDETLNAMQLLAEEIADLTGAHKGVWSSGGNYS